MEPLLVRHAATTQPQRERILEKMGSTDQQIQYSVIQEQEWESFPGRTSGYQKGPNPWEAVLDALETGQTVMIGFTDAKDLKGKRLAVGRRASIRGFKVETRFDADRLAIRKKGDTAEAMSSTFLNLDNTAAEEVEEEEEQQQPLVTAATVPTPTRRGPGRPRKSTIAPIQRVRDEYADDRADQD